MINSYLLGSVISKHRVTMMPILYSVVECWGTKPVFRLGGYLWVFGMFSLLATLEANRIGLFLVPPFGATLTILFLLPDAAIAQPYALIGGSVCGAAVGTGISCFGRGLGMAVLALIVAFTAMNLIRAYHPPGVALAIYPILLEPGHWFALAVVLPFTAVAVGSLAALSKWSPSWPKYPKPLHSRG